MRFFSFVQNGIELSPIEVELSLMAGLPQFQIMGLPDPAIKESQLRIKSALRHQGFELPTRKQVLINLRPPYMRKSSRGLDLAIAAAYLWRTGQIEWPKELQEEVYLYGELNLEGQVQAPEDLEGMGYWPEPRKIISGVPQRELPFAIYGLRELKDLANPQFFPAMDRPTDFQRPGIPDLQFGKKAADLLAIVATGEHSILLTGPSGSGKTTWAEALHKLLREPNNEELRQIRQINFLVGRPLNWRPLVAPHHTIPPLSMIGGGAPPFPGEITRAHGGALVLDELLEFHPQVKEALREPIERGEITIARRGRSRQYPARFQLVATSNLCPCGEFVPGRMVNCRFSLNKCRAYSEKLSGPLLDRFEILAFSHEWNKGSLVPMVEIFKQVQAAQAFALESRGQAELNSRVRIEALEKSFDPFILKHLLPETGSSRRRHLAVLRVARSVADLEAQQIVTARHIEKATELCLKPFYKLKSAFA